MSDKGILRTEGRSPAGLRGRFLWHRDNIVPPFPAHKWPHTWRISNYTPEYRETSGVGKRPVLTPDEVLRLPIKQALVIIRGQKVLKVDKMDYSKHPEASKLRSCKASAHIPEWRRLEQEQPKPSAAQPKPQAPAPKKPVKKKPKAASTSTNTKQTAAVPTAEAPNGIITTDKDSILS